MSSNIFNTLLRERFMNLDTVQGQIIIGTVVNLSEDLVYVDVGRKKNIKFKKSEIFSDYFNPLNQLKLGQKLHFYLESYDQYENNLVLNYERGQKMMKEQTLWKEIIQKKYINGRILNPVNGGYSVGIGGLVAFLPRNHLGDIKDKTIGELKTFTLLKSNSINNNVIVSRLSAIEAWKKKKVLKNKK